MDASYPDDRPAHVLYDMPLVACPARVVDHSTRLARDKSKIAPCMMLAKSACSTCRLARALWPLNTAQPHVQQTALHDQPLNDNFPAHTCSHAAMEASVNPPEGCCMCKAPSGCPGRVWLLPRTKPCHCQRILGPAGTSAAAEKLRPAYRHVLRA